MTTRLKPALIVLVAACHEAPVESCPSPRVAGISAERAAPVARPSPFDSVFQAAGTEFDMSPALLKAIGWVETRWQMVEGREEFAGRPPVFGVMALGGTALERGAALERRPTERHHPEYRRTPGELFPTLDHLPTRLHPTDRLEQRRRHVKLGAGSLEHGVERRRPGDGRCPLRRDPRHAR